MTSLEIHASSHNYPVEVKDGLRFQIGEKIEDRYQSVLIITDDTVEQLYLNDVKTGLKGVPNVHSAVVPTGEASKSMKQYERLLDRCIEANLDRKSLIIALGGGMVGDLAGFVASTYLRGIDYIQMPTTILAHDSSVGGKVAINHPKGKNLIGCFYNPQHVLYDTGVIATLPASEVRSGYGEVIKHAFLSDREWSHELLSQRLSELSEEQLERDLTRGILVKAGIVEKDEREAGLRKHLNLGHTLAHAIEADLGYGEITHGEAVGIGILFMMKLSQEIKGAILPVKEYTDWLVKNDYPLSVLMKVDAERMVERMKWDKKTINQKINFVLLEDIGSACVEQVKSRLIVEQLNLLKGEVSGL